MDSSHLCFLEDSFNFVPLTGECYQRQIFIDCLLDASWEPPLMEWSVDHICSSFVVLSEHLAYGPGFRCPLHPWRRGSRDPESASWRLTTSHSTLFFPTMCVLICGGTGVGLGVWAEWSGLLLLTAEWGYLENLRSLPVPEWGTLTLGTRLLSVSSEHCRGQ